LVTIPNWLPEETVIRSGLSVSKRRLVNRG
jgi:hypothetical protein